MLIYQMTHIPTGKIYLGSLKNSARWNRYYSSSKVVAPMMKSNPNEWHREILLDQFSPDTTFFDVVSFEESLISAYVTLYGWEKLWNQCAGGLKYAYAPKVIERRINTLRKTLTSRSMSQEQRLKIGVSNKGKVRSQSIKDYRSSKQKQLWQNPVYKDRMTQLLHRPVSCLFCKKITTSNTLKRHYAQCSR